MTVAIAIATPPVHRFEAAGLGKAPFTLIGFERRVYVACPGAPAQPGSSCDYCGTSISLVFMIQSADLRRFKVGCDCVEKTGDAGLVRAVKREQSQARREVSAAKREVIAIARRRNREGAAKARR
jgi:hypothetical protein